MTRYNDEPYVPGEQLDGYQEGVDRVLEYVESTHSYPKLMAELKWAIEGGII